MQQVKQKAEPGPVLLSNSTDFSDLTLIAFTMPGSGEVCAPSSEKWSAAEIRTHLDRIKVALQYGNGPSSAADRWWDRLEQEQSHVLLRLGEILQLKGASIASFYDCCCISSARTMAGNVETFLHACEDLGTGTPSRKQLEEWLTTYRREAQQVLESSKATDDFSDVVAIIPALKKLANAGDQEWRGKAQERVNHYLLLFADRLIELGQISLKQASLKTAGFENIDRAVGYLVWELRSVSPQISVVNELLKGISYIVSQLDSDPVGGAIAQQTLFRTGNDLRKELGLDPVPDVWTFSPAVPLERMDLRTIVWGLLCHLKNGDSVRALERLCNGPLGALEKLKEFLDRVESDVPALAHDQRFGLTRARCDLRLVGELTKELEIIRTDPRYSSFGAYIQSMVEKGKDLEGRLETFRLTGLNAFRRLFEEVCRGIIGPEECRRSLLARSDSSSRDNDCHEILCALLDLSPSELKRKRGSDEVGYMPTGSALVLTILEKLQLTSDDTLADLGCGKGGGVALTVLGSKARSIGFEIDPELSNAAIENLKRLGLDSRARIVNQSVVDADLREATVFYLFNPFSGKTLQIAIEKMAEVGRRRPGTRIVSLSNNGELLRAARRYGWRVEEDRRTGLCYFTM